MNMVSYKAYIIVFGRQLRRPLRFLFPLDFDLNATQSRRRRIRDRSRHQFDNEAKRRRRHSDQPDDKGAPQSRHAERLQLVTLRRTVRRTDALLHGVVRVGNNVLRD